MEIDAFDRGLRAFTRRIPLQPFVVELTSGSQFQVLHPEALAFSNGVAMHVGVDGIPRIFDHLSVRQMVGLMAVPPS